MSSFQIQSQEHRDLFDIIDKLRSQGISKYVDLPQIVVCGDQSSGKSSVLEAISGMAFPTKDNLCTRFATELILRRTPDPEASCKVSIIPDPDRDESEKIKLGRFQPDIDLATLNLGDVVEKAKEEMGLSETRRFSNDILSVELCGPTQPHLTMIDLPGLFKAGNKDQSKEDANIVERMVVKYMKQPRSIILAVVSAKNDFANQQVTDLARQIDPNGARTLGLITKPDTLHRGSDSERFYTNLVQNKDVKFRLGWHVVRNRDYPERDYTAEERNEVEDAFFALGLWATLNRNLVGVITLKPKLSEILKDQIILQLGSLQLDVEEGIGKCEEALRRLGPPRGSASERRRYLGRVSEEFTRLMGQAVNGPYSDPFFDDPLTDAGFQRRLRAVVSKILDDFKEEIWRDGQSRSIVNELPDPPTALSDRIITRPQYVEEVKLLMQRSRGRELPGLYDPMIVGELFSQQCQPWERITIACKEKVLQATFETINSVLEHVAAPETSYAILQSINDGVEKIRVNLQATTAALLRPHQRGHPITYNSALLDAVKKSQSKRKHLQLETQLVDALGAQSKSSSLHSVSNVTIQTLAKNLDLRLQEDMESQASSSAIEYMEAYYEVALGRFIDDISVLAIEECLMRSIPSLFCRDMVDDLGDQDIKGLAKEGDEAFVKRQHWTDKLRVLGRGVIELRRFERHRVLAGAPDILPLALAATAVDLESRESKSTTSVVTPRESDTESEIRQAEIPVDCDETKLVEEVAGDPCEKDFRGVSTTTSKKDKKKKKGTLAGDIWAL